MSLGIAVTLVPISNILRQPIAINVNVLGAFVNPTRLEATFHIPANAAYHDNGL
jgi:hypothetical protein